ncbi:MAG: hypothetical protein ABSB32_07075, partial [Thermodesulfobacteriota bacterium]
AWGGREHTEVRALDPGRSTSSCPSHFLFFYNMINNRRKKAASFLTFTVSLGPNLPSFYF